jgi:hypothetical protein
MLDYEFWMMNYKLWIVQIVAAERSFAMISKAGALRLRNASRRYVGVKLQIGKAKLRFAATNKNVVSGFTLN